MKTITDWFNQYEVSHKNPTNKKIHLICVPLIFLSVLGMGWFLPSISVTHFTLKWPYLFLAVVSFYYFFLSLQLGTLILTFSASLLLLFDYFIEPDIYLAWSSLIVFAAAWVGQFYGHKLEGKKPSFFTDLTFLLIGPLWVCYYLKLKSLSRD